MEIWLNYLKKDLFRSKIPITGKIRTFGKKLKERCLLLINAFFFFFVILECRRFCAGFQVIIWSSWLQFLWLGIFEDTIYSLPLLEFPQSLLKWSSLLLSLLGSVKKMVICQELQSCPQKAHIEQIIYELKKQERQALCLQVQQIERWEDTDSAHPTLLFDWTVWRRL